MSSSWEPIKLTLEDIHRGLENLKAQRKYLLSRRGIADPAQRMGLERNLELTNKHIIEYKQELIKKLINE